ncbi:hypothetical protein GE09DRAFT_177446 [Coniochaeta sp. 2T2.1]|nr:hypothetical protein GE09DRAFT_177446 [Coniochaeta sp. 2T2.1]
MQLTSLLVLGAALGAMAVPSGHSHLHRSAHEKREPAFYKAWHSKVGKPAAATPTTAAAAAPAATTASAAPAAVSSSSSSAPVPGFCGNANSNTKRASLADIASKGNTGRDGWGSNIKLIANDAVNKCEYTTIFKNVAQDPYKVICTNKIGPTGLIDGFWHTAMDFTLNPGESKTVAFDGDSQGLCTFGAHEVPKTNWGQLAGTYYEFDFASARNNLWSGADCSSLVAASEPGQPIFGCDACDPDDGTCSTILPDGSGTNSFIAGTAELDGLGINKPPGKASFHVKVGYTG